MWGLCSVDKKQTSAANVKEHHLKYDKQMFCFLLQVGWADGVFWDKKL